jgi:hypothetical protein
VRLAAIAEIAAIGALSFGATACGRTHERSSNGSNGKNRADAGMDAGNIVIDPATGQGVQLGTDRVPDLFPKTIPIYPGAKVVGAVTSTDGTKRTIVVTLYTDDSLAQVDDFYQSHLKGLQTVREKDDVDTRTRVLEDATLKLHLTIAATRSGAGTTVQLTSIEG